jgi:hypothetical protein
MRAGYLQSDSYLAASFNESVTQPIIILPSGIQPGPIGFVVYISFKHSWTN